MFEWLVDTFSSHPYAGVAFVFLLCGVGLPLPEEIVLLFAGFVCYQKLADTPTMMATCISAILLGDLIPYTLGRTYGPRLLRIRLMRWLVTPERLARFDRWFRRRGEWVVLISRFIVGIRVVSFFTAGTMKMSWTRFLLLDLAGIVPIAVLLVWLGDRYGGAIEAVIGHVRQVERGLLITAIAAGTCVGLWYWLRWRRRQQMLVGGPAETYVEPSAPVRREPDPADQAASDDGSPGPVAAPASAAIDDAIDDAIPPGESADPTPDPDRDEQAS